MQVFRHLPRFLRIERQRQGRTQEEVARSAGLSKTQISKIETGAQTPNLDTLDRLLAGLELHFGEFSRRYLDFLHSQPNGAAVDASLPSSPSSGLLALVQHIAQGSFETDEHYVVVIPKPVSTVVRPS